MESLLYAMEIGLSVQFKANLLTRDRFLSLLCVSTASEVLIFDFLQGPGYFQVRAPPDPQKPRLLKSGP